MSFGTLRFYERSRSENQAPVCPSPEVSSSLLGVVLLSMAALRRHCDVAIAMTRMTHLLGDSAHESYFE
eukprot:2643061-Amphidinium_carterae.1